MVADEMNVWPSSSCCVRQLGLPRRRQHNEDGSSNGRDFATFGTDEPTMLPINMTRERWETHTCGWHQDEQRHCFTNRFQMVVTVWTSKAQRRTAWSVLNEPHGDGWILMDTSLAVAIRSDERWNVFGDCPRVFAVDNCNCGCVETPVKKPDDWAIPPFPTIHQS